MTSHEHDVRQTDVQASPRDRSSDPRCATPAQESASKSADLTNTERETSAVKQTSVVTYRPAMDLYEYADRYEVHFDVPGSTPEGIEVTVNEGRLTIAARVAHRGPIRRDHAEITPLLHEFGIGDFHRVIRIGEDIDREALAADYTDGVLVLTLPKRRERQPRRIRVSRNGT